MPLKIPIKSPLKLNKNQLIMISYSWKEMDKWSKTELISHIRALEHELAKPVQNMQRLDKNESK